MNSIKLFLMKRYEHFPTQERCSGSNQCLPKVNNQSNFLKVYFGFSWFNFTTYFDTVFGIDPHTNPSVDHVFCGEHEMMTP